MHKHGGNEASPADRVDMNPASHSLARPQRPTGTAMGMARLATASSTASIAMSLPAIERPRAIAPLQGRIECRESRKAIPMKTRRMKKTGILKFRIDADTYASLKSYCAQSGQSMSVVLRELLERELARAAADGHPTVPPTPQADGQIRFEQ